MTNDSGLQCQVFEKYLNVKTSVVVEDAGHSVHRKKPLEVANAIKDFSWGNIAIAKVTAVR